VFATPPSLKPPLHVGWHYTDGALLEFPPVIFRGTMYLLDDNGSARAVNTHTGHELWKRSVGTLAAASPAVAARPREVLMPVLSTQGRSPGAGRFVALSMKTGKVIWSRPLGAGSESSPVVNGETVYYGDQAGNLFARNVRNGHLYWTYHAGGVLYFGDYSGRAYAVRAINGRQVWAVGTNGAHFGFGSGQFYSTPAVAFGRVYMGNTDGRVYSFGARTGALAWATSTGAYVYASAAVASPKGVGPTVYIGSYDGDFYAFNAQSGAVRWRHPSGGRISGSATVLGNIVYYSVLGSRVTRGLNVATGQQVFFFNDGAFTPTIADYHAIYLVGYASIYQMLPRTHRKARPHAKPRRHKTKRTATRRRGGTHRAAKKRARPPSRRHAKKRARPPAHKSAATRARRPSKRPTTKSGAGRK
jgi:outer membrane protein assembly factor BamB